MKKVKCAKCGYLCMTYLCVVCHKMHEAKSIRESEQLWDKDYAGEFEYDRRKEWED